MHCNHFVYTNNTYVLINKCQCQDNIILFFLRHSFWFANFFIVKYVTSSNNHQSERQSGQHMPLDYHATPCRRLLRCAQKASLHRIAVRVVYSTLIVPSVDNKNDKNLWNYCILSNMAHDWSDCCQVMKSDTH